MTIRKFILKTLLAALPVFAAIAVYAIADPFNILRFRADKSTSDNAVGRNMGVVSINTFLNNNDRRHYDSFIFGSSMSQNFQADHWAKYLPADASIIHLDATMETIDGIVDKINFLNRHSTEVAHALIIVEEEMLRRTPLDGDILHVRPPQITDEVSLWHFHTLFFNAFKNPTVMAYSLMPDKFRNAMIDEGFITTDGAQRTDATNEYRYIEYDSLLRVNPDSFYTDKRIRDIERYAENLPGADNTVMTPHLVDRLNALKKLLDKNHTDYIVIIPPRYHRRWLSPADLNLLCEILGKDRVKDFSRDEVLCNNPRAFYDPFSHLTAFHCNSLIDRAYRSRSNTAFEPAIMPGFVPSAP